MHAHDTEGGARRCDLCNSDLALVVDVLVRETESIRRLCLTCLGGMARCGTYEVKVLAEIIRVVPAAGGGA
jgi:transcriptional regulator NrdR family protein